MRVLSLEQLLQIHVLVVRETGGSGGLRDLGRLEAAVATQTQPVFEKESYETLADKAAALIRGIIADHPFIDGNKRTAMLAGLTFLSLNGVSVDARPGEIEEFAVTIVTRGVDVKGIADWLEAHYRT